MFYNNVLKLSDFLNPLRYEKNVFLSHLFYVHLILLSNDIFTNNPKEDRTKVKLLLLGSIKFNYIMATLILAIIVQITS